MKRYKKKTPTTNYTFFYILLWLTGFRGFFYRRYFFCSFFRQMFCWCRCCYWECYWCCCFWHKDWLIDWLRELTKRHLFLPLTSKWNAIHSFVGMHSIFIIGKCNFSHFFEHIQKGVMLLNYCKMPSWHSLTRYTGKK